MSDVNTRAVVTGSLVDVVGSFVMGYVLYLVVTATAGAPSAEQLQAIYTGSVTIQGVQLVLGLLMTAVGAYVGARLAPKAERVNAFAVGVVSTIVGFTIVFSAPDSAPFWAQASGLILTIPAAFAGGEVARVTAGRGKPA